MLEMASISLVKPPVLLINDTFSLHVVIFSRIFGANHKTSAPFKHKTSAPFKHTVFTGKLQVRDHVLQDLSKNTNKLVPANYQ